MLGAALSQRLTRPRAEPPVIARFFPWAMPAFNTEGTQVLLYGKGFANTQGVPGANAIRCEVGGSLWPGDCAVVNDTVCARWFGVVV